MTPLENISSADDGTTTTTSTIIMDNNNNNNNNTDTDINAITEQHQHQHQPVTTTTTTTTTSSTLSSTSSTSSSPVLVNVLHDDEDDDEDEEEDDSNILGQGKVKHENDPLSSSLLPLLPQTENTTSATTTTTTTTTSLQSNHHRIQHFVLYIWKQYIHQIVGKIRSFIQLYYGSSSTNTRSISNNDMDSTTTTTTTTRSLSVSSFVYQSLQKCIHFYNQFITKPSNQDKILKLLQYTFYMISISIVSNQNSSNISSSNTNNNNTNNKTLLISKWLYKLYTEFTWARYVLRIIQLPIAIDAAINHSWTIQALSPSSTSIDNDNDTTTDTTNSISTKASSFVSSLLLSCKEDPKQQRQKIYNLFGNIMSYSMVLYYPTELMAYLLWMKPPSIVPSTTTLPSSTSTSIQYPPYEECNLTTSTITSPSMKYRMLLTYMYRTFYTTTKLLQPSNNQNQKSSSLLSKLSNIPPETWSYISSRCWLTYIVTELIQCIVQYKELNNQISISSLSKQNSSEVDKDGTTVTTIDEQLQLQQIVLQSIRNILFLIPCMTWSLSDWDTKPIVSLRTVNTLLWFESIVSIYQAIIIQIQSK